MKGDSASHLHRLLACGAPIGGGARASLAASPSATLEVLSACGALRGGARALLFLGRQTLLSHVLLTQRLQDFLVS